MIQLIVINLKIGAQTNIHNFYLKKIIPTGRWAEALAEQPEPIDHQPSPSLIQKKNSFFFFWQSETHQGFTVYNKTMRFTRAKNKKITREIRALRKQRGKCGSHPLPHMFGAAGALIWKSLVAFQFISLLSVSLQYFKRIPSSLP